MEKKNLKIIGSTVAAIVLGVAIVVLSLYIDENKTVKVLNLAILVLGFSAGWVAGILISPYDAKESKRFSDLTKVVGVFASGYLVGKIDKLVGRIFDPDFALHSLPAFRIAAFFSAFIVAMLVTFIYRWYTTVDG